MKYRVALITKSGIVKGENFATREEADIWLLSIMEKEGVTKYRVIDRKTKEVLEDERGRRDKKK